MIWRGAGFSSSGELSRLTNPAGDRLSKGRNIRSVVRRFRTAGWEIALDAPSTKIFASDAGQFVIWVKS